MDRRKEVERWLALRDRLELMYRELSERCGLHPSTLAHWAGRLKRAPSSRDTVPEFVEVVSNAGPSASPSDRSPTRVEIDLGHERRLIVDAANDPGRLAPIRTAVGRC